MIQDASVPLQLADGTGVILRPVASSDREYFRMGFRSMSPESRYRRFFSCLPGLSDAQLRYLTEVDQINHVAWVAVAAEPTPTAGLGVARFVRMPEQPAIAEFSLAVIDPMQRKGLGRAFLTMLCLSAAERGVGILRAVCLAENETLVSSGASELNREATAREPSNWIYTLKEALVFPVRVAVPLSGSQISWTI